MTSTKRYRQRRMLKQLLRHRPNGKVGSASGAIEAQIEAISEKIRRNTKRIKKRQSNPHK